MAQQSETATLKMEIEGITYIVSTYYSDGEESIIDKITRLVQGDENITKDFSS